MKKKKVPSKPLIEPTEDDVRDYAYHLYEQSGCLPGHDLDNWLEAKVCLQQSIPRHQSHTRLHRHIQRPEFDVSPAPELDARSLTS